MEPADGCHALLALKRYFGWLLEEREIRESPMQRMKSPTVPERTTAILSDGDVRKILHTCDGRDFDDAPSRVLDHDRGRPRSR